MSEELFEFKEKTGFDGRCGDLRYTFIDGDYTTVTITKKSEEISAKDLLELDLDEPEQTESVIRFTQVLTDAQKQQVTILIRENYTDITIAAGKVLAYKVSLENT